MTLLQLHTGDVRELYESYEQLRARCGQKDESWAAVAVRMLELLPGLEKVCNDRVVWGLLSHYSLCLLSRRDFRARPHVVVVADSSGYRVSYKMHPDDAPWPIATVEGHTDSSAEAAKLVAIAMDRSGGWSSDEDRIETSWRARREGTPGQSTGTGDGHDR